MFQSYHLLDNLTVYESLKIPLSYRWLRWVALVAGIGATVLAMRGAAGPAGDRKLERWGLAFVAALDLQLLLGLAARHQGLFATKPRRARRHSGSDADEGC